MTDEEIRRIRRLVVGELPPTVATPRPVDPRHEERFRRALAGPRRSPVTASHGGDGADASPRVRQERETTASVRTSPHPSAKTPSSAASTASTAASTATPTATPTALRRAREVRPLLGDADADADVSEIAEVPDHDSADASTPLAASPSLALDRPPLHLSDLPAMPSGSASLPADLPNDWARGLADTVLTLCTGSDPNFHSWTIQVPIDSAALPHTELRMTFSRHHLLLRFSTQSTQSYALISAHQSQLHRLLSCDLPGDRHIDIELT